MLADLCSVASEQLFLSVDMTWLVVRCLVRVISLVAI